MDNLDIGLDKSQNEDSRSPESRPDKFTKIYVGNLPMRISKEPLKEFMSQFGEIERCVIVSRGSKSPYAFLTFKNESSYEAALAANGIILENETLVINKHYPTKESEDGTKEFQRTIFIGNVPRGMSQDDLEKTIFTAIHPIQANFRTHHTLRSGNQPGMKLIKTGDSDTNPDIKMCAFLVFRSLAEAEEAGNILSDVELGDEKFIVEFSKGRKMGQYRENQCRIIHIGNIPLTATEEEITRKFRLYGELTNVRLISDRSTGLSKGYAFLDFRKPADAQHAVTVLTGTKWDGQEFIVHFEKNAKRRTENERRRSGRSDNRPFRRKRSFTPERRRKRQRSLSPRRRSSSPRRTRGASRDIYNYNVTPERRYNNDQSRPSYNSGVPTDGNEVTLFVSNLPNAAEHRVRYLLEQLAGPMVLFRKEGLDGWLTYEDHRCAMVAHDILRDHKIEGIRLVVEVLESRPSSRGADDGFRLRQPTLPKLLPREPNHSIRESRGWSDDLSGRREPDRKNSHEDPYIERKYNDHPPKRARTADHVVGNKLFLGNLSLELSKADLTRLFNKYGQIESVKLPTKEGKSTRYGFVNYIYPEDASRAQRDLDGYMLKGRPLRVEISTSKARLGNNRPRNTSSRPRERQGRGRGRRSRAGHDIWVRDPEKR